MFLRSTRRLGITIAGVLLSGMAFAPGALAAGPDHFGPFAWNDTIYFSCGTDFEVRLDTHGTESFTIWSDDNGDIDRVLYRVRAPRDVFTNLSTGRSIVVRGEFQEMIERIPGTDEFTKSINGFRYLINDPSVGVVFQEVGRIIYGDVEQTIVLWQAGQHEGVYGEDLEPTFCGLLAQPV